MLHHGPMRVGCGAGCFQTYSLSEQVDTGAFNPASLKKREANVLLEPPPYSNRSTRKS